MEKARGLPPEPFRLTAYWHIHFIRQAVPQERKTRYTVRLAQSENYGLGTGLSSRVPALNADFVGKDVRQILKNRQCRDRIDRTAFVDLVMGHLPQTADNYVTLASALREKYSDRAGIFADEAERIIQSKGAKGNGARVLIIGATAGIIAALTNRGFDVSAIDLDAAIVGRKLAGVKVRDGRVASASLMKEADLAIITGMALPNRTLPSLMKLAQQFNTSTMIWAITGRNFGRYYTEHGVDCVISDPSPFLLLPGPARFAIHRRNLS